MFHKRRKMELYVVYAFIAVVASFGILSIKDVILFNKIHIKSIVTLSVLAVINLPLMVISMVIINNMPLGFLLLSMFICEVLHLNTIYVTKKNGEKENIKKQTNNNSVVSNFIEFKKTSQKNKRAI